MHLQLRPVKECLTTQLTVMRTFTSVLCPTVNKKRVATSKFLNAVITLVWFLTCVGTSMDPQIVTLGKRLQTDITLICLGRFGNVGRYHRIEHIIMALLLRSYGFLVSVRERHYYHCPNFSLSSSYKNTIPNTTILMWSTHHSLLFLRV